MNLFAILVAVVVSMAIGFLWYSPWLFGNVWMKLINRKPDDVKDRSMLLPVGSSILASFLVATLFERASLETPQMAIVALLLWLIFCVALRLPHYLFEGRSLRLFLIEAGHDLCTVLVSALIVSAWN